MAEIKSANPTMGAIKFVSIYVRLNIYIKQFDPQNYFRFKRFSFKYIK